MRFTWQRDAAGMVTRFEQDGTDSFDNPFVDGEPDFAESYSAGCESLLMRFPWLAHEPGPDSAGPRFRNDRF